MPYKDLKKNREAHRNTMRKKRQGVTSGVTNDGVTYPAIIYALTDPVKRKKLEKITLSLKDFKQAENVCYGVNGPAFDAIGDLLDATK